MAYCLTIKDPQYWNPDERYFETFEEALEALEVFESLPDKDNITITINENTNQILGKYESMKWYEFEYDKMIQELCASDQTEIILSAKDLYRICQIVSWHARNGA